MGMQIQLGEIRASIRQDLLALHIQPTKKLLDAITWRIEVDARSQASNTLVDCLKPVATWRKRWNCQQWTWIRRVTTLNDLFQRSLGSAPAMTVTGYPVTSEQACEIIRRTDRLFVEAIANDRTWLLRIAHAVRLPLFEEYVLDLKGEAYQRARQRWQVEHRQWLQAWGFLETELVHNDWIASRFLYGPHGWCHPDGTIGFQDCVGKGQIAEEVYDDWCRLAQAFPFLNVSVTLLRECLDEEFDLPQVSFRVRNGEVYIVDPAMIGVHAEHRPPTRGSSVSRYTGEHRSQEIEDKFAAFTTITQLMHSSRTLQMIPWEWIEAWAAMPFHQ